MAEVMGECDRLGEVFVEPESACDGAADGCDLDGVREARAKVIAGTVEENLGFVFEAAECLRVDDSRTVTLVFRPMRMWRFGMFASGGLGGSLRVGCESVVLDSLEFSASPHRGGFS